MSYEGKIETESPGRHFVILSGPPIRQKGGRNMRLRSVFRCGALLLALAPSVAFATSISDLALVYHASFDDGTLNPSFDPLGYGPLRIGDGEIAGTNPLGLLEDQGLTLGITHPASLVGLTNVSATLTPVSFGPGSIVGMRAVYAVPVGPHGTGDVWAVVLGVRTGGVDDIATNTRAAATLQVRGNGARLNTPGSSVPGNSQNVPQDVYDALFPAIPDPNSPATFTMDLIVDRVTGASIATLYVRDFVVSQTVLFSAFGPDGGLTITNIGVALAMNTGSGTSASVGLLDFQVFGAPVPEPSMWALLGSGLLLVVVARFRSRQAGRDPRS
jgi:hypothetical protein